MGTKICRDRGDWCENEYDPVEGVRGTSEERVQELLENVESKP